MTRLRPALVLTALVLLVGCGAAAPQTPAPAPAAVQPAPTADADRTAEDAACRDGAKTAGTVRSIAAALQEGPVLPAGVALFLLDARVRAAAPGIDDPALLTAQTELVAAIDDLDAQGRALLPPGGSPAQNRVQLDPTRIVAAVAEIERVCGTPT